MISALSAGAGKRGGQPLRPPRALGRRALGRRALGRRALDRRALEVAPHLVEVELAAGVPRLAPRRRRRGLGRRRAGRPCALRGAAGLRVLIVADGLCRRAAGSAPGHGICSLMPPRAAASTCCAAFAPSPSRPMLAPCCRVRHGARRGSLGRPALSAGASRRVTHGRAAPTAIKGSSVSRVQPHGCVLSRFCWRRLRPRTSQRFRTPVRRGASRVRSGPEVLLVCVCGAAEAHFRKPVSLDVFF